MEQRPFDSPGSVDDLPPATQPEGKLVPLPRSERQWTSKGLPPAFVHAVDRVLDALDSAADAVRDAVRRAGG